MALGGWLGWPRGGAVARALLTRLTSAWRIGRLRILLPAGSVASPIGLAASCG
ncbi:hypothetical protein BZL29_2159 [Mycobacterium kansasii]|uniref:Uncharacterized protein n=1 Tax=Mycobacterium kansasii TaxID=1768 RepID=A0A1V3XPI6_MYCKA|nr:hypothetical protein BZL29_2159 [Mycobacterium kansasii]